MKEYYGQQLLKRKKDNRGADHKMTGVYRRLLSLSLPPVDGQASVEEESKRCKLCSDGQPVCGPLLKA